MNHPNCHDCAPVLCVVCLCELEEPETRVCGLDCAALDKALPPWGEPLRYDYDDDNDEPDGYAAMAANDVRRGDA